MVFKKNSCGSMKEKSQPTARIVVRNKGELLWVRPAAVAAMLSCSPRAAIFSFSGYCLTSPSPYHNHSFFSSNHFRPLARAILAPPLSFHVQIPKQFWVILILFRASHEHSSRVISRVLAIDVWFEKMAGGSEIWEKNL